MAGLGAARAADPQDLAATVCAMAGYLTHQSLLPAPPGLPTLRTFQAAQGVVAEALAQGADLTGAGQEASTLIVISTAS